jgi:diguanylate cyclase (GGDEF)-like protein/PAS domain S-box-containing protein
MSTAEPPLGPLPGATSPEVVASTLLLIPDAALWLDEHDRVRAVNARAIEMFRGDVVGRRYAELVVPSGERLDGAHAVGARCDGVPFAVEASLGRNAWGALVTLREPAPASLPALAQQHFDAAFETAPIGMALFDPDGRYIRVNDALSRMLGVPVDDLLGRRDQEFTHEDDRPADVEAAWAILRGERSTHQCEKRFVRADGGLIWVIANLAFLRDDHGRPIGWVGQFQDITNRRNAEDHLRALADRDPLTGLLNRRAFDRELHRHLALEPRVEGGLLVIDLDGFKAINDAHGHRAGDDVLVRCAGGLLAVTRSEDLVARLGGDEFAIFAPGISDQGLERLCERVRTAVGDVSEIAAVQASVGASTTGEVDRCPDALMAAADRRMYAAKSTGREGG